MKKLLITSMMGICIFSMMGMSAMATSLFQTNGRTSNLSGTDKWNRGISSGDNGYYMAYSYYYNAKYAHAAKADLEDSSDTSELKLAGKTASANSDSYPTYSSAAVYAAVLSNSSVSDRYVKDTGNGDRVVSDWN